MFKMFSCLLLLAALLLGLSAPQRQTKTVDQKLSDLTEWLSSWRDASTENQQRITGNQIKLQSDVLETQVGLSDTLEEVVAEAVSIKAQLSELQNQTKQLLTDLQVLKGRQVVSGGIQGFLLFILITYLITITILCVVKQCNKHREKSQQKDFELLEKHLRQRRHQRRTAAAKEKSTPAASLE